MFCRKCGCRVEAYQKFCCYCGAPVNTVPQSQPTQPDPQTPVQPEAPVQPETPVQPEAPVQPETPVQSETPVQPEAPVQTYTTTDYFDASVQRTGYQSAPPTSGMSIVSFVLGIISLLFGCCFGSSVAIDIIFLAVSGFGLIAGIIGFNKRRQINLAVSGIVLNTMAVLEFTVIIITEFLKNFTA